MTETKHCPICNLNIGYDDGHEARHFYHSHAFLRDGYCVCGERVYASDMKEHIFRLSPEELERHYLLSKLMGYTNDTEDGDVMSN